MLRHLWSVNNYLFYPIWRTVFLNLVLNPIALFNMVIKFERSEVHAQQDKRVDISTVQEVVSSCKSIYC